MEPIHGDSLIPLLGKPKGKPEYPRRVACWGSYRISAVIKAQKGYMGLFGAPREAYNEPCATAACELAIGPEATVS